MIKRFLIFYTFVLSTQIIFAAKITIPAFTIKQLLQRIALLETALSPTNPQAAATRWAEAAKNRNGAVQYMLLCPNLQKIYLNRLEASNWVTGISSPWISSYTVVPEGTKKDATQFSIQYQLAAGGKEHWNATDHLSIIPVTNKMNPSQQWCISQFNYLSPVDALN